MPAILEGDNHQIQSAITALEKYCQDNDISLDRNLEHPRALGVYRPMDNCISLRPGMPKLQELKTLVHELAHAILHDIKIERIRAELEAESTAYLTLHQLGLDTSAYSFSYLANWTDTLENLIAAGENASKAATTLVTAIQEHGTTMEEAEQPPYLTPSPASSFTSA